MWVFDLDGCLIDSLRGTSLRPGARELLTALRDRDRRVVVWSAGGAAYARERARDLGFDDLVDAFYDKAERDGSGRWDPAAFAPALDGIVFVDDQPNDLPLEADVIPVFPFLSANRHDGALAAIDITAG